MVSRTVLDSECRRVSRERCMEALREKKHTESRRRTGCLLRDYPFTPVRSP